MQAAFEPALSKENYRERLHQLLYLEEIRQRLPPFTTGEKFTT
jgi:hypothetical protein